MDIFAPTSIQLLCLFMGILGVAQLSSVHYPDHATNIWKLTSFTCFVHLAFLYWSIQTHPIVLRRSVLRNKRQHTLAELKGDKDRSGPRVIVLCTSGKLGSGKNTASDILKVILTQRIQERWPTTSVTIVDDAFALNLKRMVAACADKPLELTLSQSGKNVMLPLFGATIGETLQDQGELFRWFYGDDIWSSIVFQRERHAHKSHILILNITDGRYENEINEVLKNRFGFAIRIEGDPCGVRKRSTRDINHASETALDSFKNFSVTINNSIPNPKYLKTQLERFVDKVIMPSLSSSTGRLKD